MLTVVQPIWGMSNEPVGWVSGIIFGGYVLLAPPGHRGATMAVHVVVGFSGVRFGPMLAGIALDVSGGQTSVQAWGLTLTLIGGFGLLGLASLLPLGRQARGCALR
ncbi:MAG: hypothetical protein GDA49_01230 [Rhodospirillales bacterium]|nr:hypothetical protein [Rhodospirillales bacterium]